MVQWEVGFVSEHVDAARLGIQWHPTHSSELPPRPAPARQCQHLRKPDGAFVVVVAEQVVKGVVFFQVD